MQDYSIDLSQMASVDGSYRGNCVRKATDTSYMFEIIENIMERPIDVVMSDYYKRSNNIIFEVIHRDDWVIIISEFDICRDLQPFIKNTLEEKLKEIKCNWNKNLITENI